MTDQPLLTLRDALVSGYDDLDLARARQLAQSAGVNPGTLPRVSPPYYWWMDTIDVMLKQGKLPALVDAAIADPTVAALKQKFEALREPIAQIQLQYQRQSSERKQELSGIEPVHRRFSRSWWALFGLAALAIAAIVFSILRWAKEPSNQAIVPTLSPTSVVEAKLPQIQPSTTSPTPTATPAPTAAPQPLLPTLTPTSPVVPGPDLHAEELQFLEYAYTKQIAWSPDGRWIAIRSYDIPVLDAQTTQETHRVTSLQWPSSLAFSSDGETLAYANDQVVFVQPGTWGELGALAGSGDTTALAYSPDGLKLATAIGQVVKLWDLSSREVVRIFPGTSGFALAFSPDGKMVAAAGGTGGGEIKRWNAETGEELPALKGHTNWIKTLEFSPDGRILASGSVDQSIRLWDATTGRLLMALSGHTDAVTDVSFSPDSRLLASSSWDLTVRLWDLATGHEVQSLLGHTGWIEAVTFSPDGNRLASGASDGVRLWGIEPGHGAAPTTAQPTATTAAAAMPQS